MKSAIKNLEDDHVYILLLVFVIEQMVIRSCRKIEQLEQVIELIRDFADGMHHAKEETLLFPQMIENEFSPLQGPVSVMLMEHREGRNYVKSTSAFLAACKNGDKSALDGVYQNLSDYAILLKKHIDKENNVLFRIADQTLSVQAQQFLLKEFTEIDQNGANNKKSADYKNQITMLAELVLRKQTSDF